jgi:hypothetical protein
MKKILILIVVSIGIVACTNQPLSFPDYSLQAVYFPYQLPIRTLSLGEDRIDNSLDKQFIFDIGVSIGGMYKNNTSWTVDYIVDTSLTTKVYIRTTPQVYTKKDSKVIPLPSSYYTLSPANTATIPNGSFNGLIRVQLTDAFFNDTIAITGHYVVPLSITGTSADSVLMGKAATMNPDPRVVGNWESNKSPKYWTMYGINYVNAYHGTWLHRGRDILTRNSNGRDSTIIFRNPYGYVEKDALIVLSTIGRKKVITNGVGPQVGAAYSMVLEFADDKGSPGAITITPRPGLAFAVSGSGQYYDKATSVEQWTGLTWQSMYLSYSYNDGTFTHRIIDTLVFRDRGIKFTQNTIVIQP